MGTAEDCEGYARDCVWYGQQTDDPVLRNRLFNMALNWRAAAIRQAKPSLRRRGRSAAGGPSLWLPI